MGLPIAIGDCYWRLPIAIGDCRLPLAIGDWRLAIGDWRLDCRVPTETGSSAPTAGRLKQPGEFLSLSLVSLGGLPRLHATTSSQDLRPQIINPHSLENWVIVTHQSALAKSPIANSQCQSAIGIRQSAVRESATCSLQSAVDGAALLRERQRRRGTRELRAAHRRDGQHVVARSQP